MLLYTDGLTDAYAPTRTLGPAELRALLRLCGGLSADETAERIYRSALELGRTEPRDDIALVVLRIATTDTTSIAVGDTTSRASPTVQSAS